MVTFRQALWETVRDNFTNPDVTDFTDRWFYVVGKGTAPFFIMTVMLDTGDQQFLCNKPEDSGELAVDIQTVAEGVTTADTLAESLYLFFRGLRTDITGSDSTVYGIVANDTQRIRPTGQSVENNLSQWSFESIIRWERKE